MSVDERQKKVAQWLRKQRQEKGLTMRDVALIIDRPHSFVGKVETCERRIDVAEFADYCQRLGFDAVQGLRIAL